MKWLICAACVVLIGVSGCRLPKSTAKPPKACYVIIDVVHGSENNAAMNNVRWNGAEARLPLVVRVKDDSDIRSENVLKVVNDPKGGLTFVIAGRPMETLGLSGHEIEKYFVIHRDGVDVDRRSRPADVVYCKIFAPSEFYPGEYLVDDSTIRDIISRNPPIVMPQE